MEKFQNKYRVGSNRLKGYDYSSKGVYFINICTKNMQHYFGEVKNSKMHLNKYGKIVESIWKEVPNRFPNVNLDEYIFMPNHMHGIISIIEKDAIYDPENEKDNDCRDAIHRVSKSKEDGIENGRGAIHRTSENNQNAINRVENIDAKDISNAINRVCTERDGGITGENNPMGKKSVGEIVRWFKGRSSYEINKTNPNFFAWHNNYYEHIIRNQYAFENIRTYIASNPIKWDK